jgi:hypothetical protein
MYDETVKSQRVVNDEELGGELAKETGGLNYHTPTTGTFCLPLGPLWTRD